MLHQLASLLRRPAISWWDVLDIIVGAVVDPKMEGQVKITVIATGFDRASGHSTVSASAADTPVDLRQYAVLKQETTEKVAVAGGSSRSFTVSRRPVLDLPRVSVVNGPDHPTDAELGTMEPESPLDVPAFLRRQNE